MAFDLGTNEKKRATFERATDMRILLRETTQWRRYWSGLIAYRETLDEVLSPSEISRKHEDYYSRSELLQLTLVLDFLHSDENNNVAEMRKQWKNKPPRRGELSAYIQKILTSESYQAWRESVSEDPHFVELSTKLLPESVPAPLVHRDTRAILEKKTAPSERGM